MRLKLGVVFFLWSISLAAQRHKQVEYFYDDSHKVLKERFYILPKDKFVVDSSYWSFFQNGHLKSKGNFRRGLAHGEWEYFYESGNLRMKGLMLGDLPNGYWRYYFETGGIQKEGRYTNNKPEGEWKFYYENGELKSKGSYLEGLRDGPWFFYYESGGFKAQADLKQDKGPYIEYYPDGTTVKSRGFLDAGRSNGQWQYYYPDGTLQAEGLEKDGQKEGAWKFYHSNGKLSSSGTYAYGKQTGRWRYFHDNEQLQTEGDFDQDKKDGYWKLYSRNGAFIGEGQYIKGDGIYREYYENGKLKAEGNVLNNMNEGEWRYYYESGELEGICYFSQGSGNYTGYYKSGTKKTEGRIENGVKVGSWSLYNDDGTFAGYYSSFYEYDGPGLIKPDTLIANTPEIKDTVKTSKKAGSVSKKNSIYYFTPRLNEFRSYILSANPLAVVNNQFLVSAEYYYQERLGYELGLIYLRDPFFKNHNNLPLNKVSANGFEVYLRQKFYHRDEDRGMLYFAHEIRYGKLDNRVQTIDTTISQTQVMELGLNQWTAEYSILIGDRFLRDAKKPGWTLDVYAGIGIGYRSSANSWSEDNVYYSRLFGGVNQNKITVPFRFGFTFGYLFKR